MIATRTLPFDIDLLALHRNAPARYPMLLESTSSAYAAGNVQKNVFCSEIKAAAFFKYSKQHAESA